MFQISMHDFQLPFKPFWESLSDTSLVYHVIYQYRLQQTQLSIRDFFRSGGDNFCDGYLFGFHSIFIFFKK